MLKRKTIHLGLAGSAQVQIAVCDWCCKESVPLTDGNAAALGFRPRPGNRHECYACEDERYWRERFPRMGERPVKVALVGCGKVKGKEPAPARKLYQSPLFKLSAAYAEAAFDRWYILSAKYGLVDPDEVIEPYDRKLGSNHHERRAWGSSVHAALCSRVPTSTTFTVLAGHDYADAIALFRDEVFDPMHGLQVGQRLSWLKSKLEGLTMAKKKVEIPSEFAGTETAKRQSEPAKQEPAPKQQSLPGTEPANEGPNLSAVLRELLQTNMDASSADARGYLADRYPDFHYNADTLSSTLAAQRSKLRQAQDYSGNALASAPKQRSPRTVAPSVPTAPTMNDMKEAARIARENGGIETLAKQIKDTLALGEKFGGLPRLLACLDALEEMRSLFAD